MIESSNSAASHYQYSAQSAFNLYDDPQQPQSTCEFTPFKPTSCIDIKPRTYRDNRLEAYRDAYETATGFEDDEMFCPFELLQVSHLVLSGKLPDSKAPYHNPKKPFKGNLTSLISNSQLLSEHLRNYPLYYTVTKSPPHRTRKIYQVSNDTSTRPIPQSQFHRDPNSVHPNFYDSGVPPHPNNVGYFVPRGVPIQPMSVQPPHYADFSHYPPLKAYSYSQGYPDPNGEPRKHKKSSWYIPRKNNQTNAPSSDRTANWPDWEQYTGMPPSGTSQSPSSDMNSQYPNHPVPNLPPPHANPSAGTFAVNGFECDMAYNHPVYVSHPPPQPSQLSATTQAFHPGARILLDYLNKGNSGTQPPEQEQHQQRQYQENQNPYPPQQQQQQQQEESPPTLVSHPPQDPTTTVSQDQNQNTPSTEDTSNNTDTPSLTNAGCTVFSGRSTQKPSFRPIFSQKPRSLRGRTTSLPDELENATSCGDENIRKDGWWRRGEMV